MWALATSTSNSKPEVFRLAFKAFNFAFGLCTVGLTYARTKAVLLSAVEQFGVPFMLPLLIGIPFNHDRFSVIKQDFLRYSCKELKCIFQTIDPCIRTFMIIKFHESRSGIP